MLSLIADNGWSFCRQAVVRRADCPVKLSSLGVSDRFSDDLKARLSMAVQYVDPLVRLWTTSEAVASLQGIQHAEQPLEEVLARVADTAVRATPGRRGEHHRRVRR